MTFGPYDVLQLIGYVLRVLGSMVFGLAVGWLAVKTLQGEKMAWQLSIAAFLGLVGGFALLGYWVDGGATIGAFGLGAGGGILFWGMMANRKAPEESRSSMETKMK